jgi:asparagine N-glycosylation enzyme membrane subunit Stt3
MRSGDYSREVTRTTRSQKAVAAIAVLSILLLAAMVRCITYRQAYQEDGWHLADGDSYYHLRRVEQTIQRGGRVPMFDPHLAFPEGQRIQWHGGYDLLVAGLVVASCGTTPDRGCLTTVAAVSTPCLGVVATLLSLWLGWKLGGRWVGVGAGLLFTAYPFSAGAAALGHVDHHVLEPLLVAVWFLLLIKKRPTSSGVVAGLSFAFFPSALLPVVSTVMALSIRRLLLGERRDSDWRFVVTATLILVPVVLTGPFPDVVEPGGVSLFHLLTMATATMAVVVSEVTVRITTRRRVLMGLLPYPLFGLGLLAAVWSPLATLLHFGAARGLWTGVVQQVPLGATVAATFVIGMLLGGACIAVIVYGWREDRGEYVLLGLTALPLVSAGTLQIRFLPMASALLTPVLALTVAAYGRWLVGVTRDLRRRTRLLAMAVVGALALLMLAPLREYFFIKQEGGDHHGMRDGITLLRRLGARGPGAEAVLADWVWGHHILWFARRPTVASPFILSGRDSVNVAVRRALLSESVDDLLGLMTQRRARFLLIAPRFDPQQAARSIRLKLVHQPISKVLVAEDASGLRLVDKADNTKLYQIVR